MSVKLVVGVEILNVICVYALQVGLAYDIKRVFLGWSQRKSCRHLPQSEELFLGGDFNDHIKTKADGHDRMHRGFGYRERNSGGAAILEFTIAFDLTIVNSLFKKRRTT